MPLVIAHCFIFFSTRLPECLISGLISPTRVENFPLFISSSFSLTFLDNLAGFLEASSQSQMRRRGGKVRDSGTQREKKVEISETRETERQTDKCFLRI